MKIFDKTPFRNESGEIDIMGRVRGSLSHGLSWYPRMQAQDMVIAVMEKVLGERYALLRNVTLKDTDIELPLILVGPQGVFLINVVHERGVYRAKDDEWGTVSGEKFAPAAINQVKRVQKLGRVLQVYLERAGFKDLPVVDPILMSADPGMHIESTRPAVRIIMSDALERFAISITQGRAILGADVVNGIVKTILTGPQAKAAPVAPMAAPASSSGDTTDELFSGTGQQDSDSMGYLYNEEPAAFRSGPPQDADSQYQESGFQSLETGREGFGGDDATAFDPSQENTDAFETSQSETQPEIERRPKASKKQGLFGMTTTQLGILIAILLCWLCSMAGFAAYIYFNLNG